MLLSLLPSEVLEWLLAWLDLPSTLVLSSSLPLVQELVGSRALEGPSGKDHLKLLHPPSADHLPQQHGGEGGAGGGAGADHLHPAPPLRLGCWPNTVGPTLLGSPNTSPNTGLGNLKITIMAPNTLSLVRHPKFVPANLNEPANLYLPKRPLFLSFDVCLSCNALQWSCINV